MFYTNLGAYSIEFSINFWIQFNELKEFEFAKSDAIIAVLTSFIENGLEISYPIQQIHSSKIS